MKTRTFFIVVIVLFFNSISINAQEEIKKPCPCCTEPHQSFDFWIGDWTVYDVNGKIVGANTIKKQYDNCVLREEWKSTGANRGTSYNYYNLADKTWNQVWIDNSGFSLTLKGSYIDNQMVLKSDLLEGKKGKYYNQITWKKNEDNSVTQTWKILNEEGKTLQEAFKGIYKKTVK